VLLREVQAILQQVTHLQVQRHAIPCELERVCLAIVRHCGRQLLICPREGRQPGLIAAGGAIHDVCLQSQCHGPVCNLAIIAPCTRCKHVHQADGKKALQLAVCGLPSIALPLQTPLPPSNSAVTLSQPTCLPARQSLLPTVHITDVTAEGLQLGTLLHHPTHLPGEGSLGRHPPAHRWHWWTHSLSTGPLPTGWTSSAASCSQGCRRRVGDQHRLLLIGEHLCVPLPGSIPYAMDLMWCTHCPNLSFQLLHSHTQVPRGDVDMLVWVHYSRWKLSSSAGQHLCTQDLPPIVSLTRSHSPGPS
jgi:hypothetical protein